MATGESPPVAADRACPWLNEKVQALVSQILSSHQRAFKQPLLTDVTTEQTAGSLQVSQRLFEAGFPVLAHDGGADPLLSYATAAALQLWERPWQEMIGMPSRLTAAAGERQARAEALSSALQLDAFEGYRGVRINSQGRKFEIKNARIWTIWDHQNNACGQAASFTEWSWL